MFAIFALIVLGGVAVHKSSATTPSSKMTTSLAVKGPICYVSGYLDAGVCYEACATLKQPGRRAACLDDACLCYGAECYEKCLQTKCSHVKEQSENCTLGCVVKELTPEMDGWVKTLNCSKADEPGFCRQRTWCHSRRDFECAARLNYTFIKSSEKCINYTTVLCLNGLCTCVDSDCDTRCKSDLESCHTDCVRSCAGKF